MGKKFNVTGACIPERHYMADITAKLDAIEALIAEGHQVADSLFTLADHHLFHK